MRKTREAYVENVEQYEIHKGWKEYGAYASKGYTFAVSYTHLTLPTTPYV